MPGVENNRIKAGSVGLIVADRPQRFTEEANSLAYILTSRISQELFSCAGNVLFCFYLSEGAEGNKTFLSFLCIKAPTLF